MAVATRIRQRRFREVVFAGECGHELHYHTCWYRISEVRRASIINSAVRSGVWCDVCKANCQPEKFIEVRAYGKPNSYV